MRTTQERARAPQSLGATLFGRTRQQVLALLFGHLDEAFYVREIARRTGSALGAVQRELGVLVDAGILTRAVQGRQVYYRANRACAVFEELRSIVVKTSGLADVLRGALSTSSGRIDAAFVYGSMAGAGGTRDSDVDLFVIGDVTLGAVVECLAEAEHLLGREVNPVVQSPKEFARRVGAADHFVTRVLSEPRLFVIGDAGVVDGLAPARLARASHQESAGNRRPARAGAARSARQSRARRQS